VRCSADCTLERMNKRPGHVVVTTEVAFCSFCGRPRTLRSEQHQLGTLVRTIVTCETCHRTLSSSVGVASVEPPADELSALESPAQQETAAPPSPKSPKSAPKPAAKPAAPRKPAAAAAKGTAAKSRTPKKAT
jgi:hypothetical protein